MPKPKILSITYDESLQRTRQMILENAGFDATSALGFVDAQSLCATGGFDLVVIGHSLPTHDKIALIKTIKEGSGGTVLCLRTSNAPVLREADYSTDRTDPDGLVEAVKAALNGNQG